MPIRWRLTIFNALVIGGILLALGCTLFFLLRETLLSSVEDIARKRALAAAKEIDRGEGLDEENGRLLLDDGLKHGLTHDGVFIVVRNGRGNIITTAINSTRVKPSSSVRHENQGISFLPFFLHTFVTAGPPHATRTYSAIRTVTFSA